jgi:hypothetical protein
LTLFSTLPTLCSTPVATSDMPAGPRDLDQVRARLLDAADQAVELARQDADLVRTVGADAAREVLAARDLDRVRRQRGDRLEHRALQELQQDQEQERPGRDRGRQRVADRARADRGDVAVDLGAHDQRGQLAHVVALAVHDEVLVVVRAQEGAVRTSRPRHGSP